MAVSERELEENEAKLDNILHKVIVASKQIQELRERINLEMPAEYNKQLLDEMNTLSEIIENLATLADEIDIKDEQLTERAESEMNDHGLKPVVSS